MTTAVYLYLRRLTQSQGHFDRVSLYFTFCLLDKMADANVAHLFQNLAVEMSNVSTALGAQGINQLVTPYEGDPKKFKEWVKSIEKYAVLSNLGNDRIKRVAYQASRGPVSEFIRRYQDNNQNATWDQLKAELNVRFSEVTDAQHAVMLLRKVRQKPGETVQVYAERLLTLAEDAFQGQQGAAVQRQQIDIFVDGLLEDQLKLKVLRDNPQTLEAAVTTATNEQNLRKRFNLRTRHQYVPSDDDNRMEVDHYRPARRCFKCNKTGHLAKNCHPKPRVNAVDNAKSQGGADHKKEMICWYCAKKGHFKKECRKRQADLNRGRNSPGVSPVQTNQEN